MFKGYKKMKSDSKEYRKMRNKFENSPEFKNYRNNRIFLKKLLEKLKIKIENSNYLNKDTSNLIYFISNQHSKVLKLKSEQDSKFKELKCQTNN